MSTKEFQSNVKVSGNLNVAGCLNMTNKGSVTQITSDSTPVTLNSCAGKITTVSLTTPGGSAETFTCNNSTVSTSSIVLISINEYSGSSSVVVEAVDISAGSFDVRLRNVGGAALNNTATIGFMVI